jgi:hypothetical protein
MLNQTDADSDIPSPESRLPGFGIRPAFMRIDGEALPTASNAKPSGAFDAFVALVLSAVLQAWEIASNSAQKIVD